MSTATKPEIRVKKRRTKESEVVFSRKMILEEPSRYRIQFPAENREAYEPELLAITGARYLHRIPYNPKGDIPEDQITFLEVFSVPKSDENLQTVARFGKAHRFDFDSDLAVRAFAASSEGKALEKMSYAIRASKEFTLPKLGSGKDKPLPFQPAGVEYLLRVKRGFLADEMGLGKTIQGIAGIAADRKFPWLIVVPANLKINWYREVKKWLKPMKLQGRILKVAMLTNKQLTKTPKGNITVATKKFLKEQQIVIVNYDRVEKYLDYLKSVPWRGMIFDESHYLKGVNARRSKACNLLVRHAEPEYVWMLSGTPLMNKPIELVSQLRILDRLGDFGGYNNFVHRYCTFSTANISHLNTIAAAQKAQLAALADATAAGEELVVSEDPLAQKGIEDAMLRKLYENMTDLNRQLRSTCYVRREKSEVLKDLPAKTRSTIPFEITNRKEYEKVEADVCGYLADRAVKDEKFLEKIKKMSAEKQKELITERRNSTYYKSAKAEALEKLRMLQLTASIGKMKPAIQWIEDFLASGQKLVVFAHNHIIIDELIDAFPTAVHTKGNAEARDAAVQSFQEDPEVRLFIGSLKRDGVGITLTASHATAFLQLGWNPATHDQAEDRVHRIGQKDAVTAYYLIANNTVEARVAKLIEGKRRLVNAVQDGDPLHNAHQGSIQTEILEAVTSQALTLKDRPKRKSKKVEVEEEE